jgi:hypothetical protein
MVQDTDRTVPRLEALVEVEPDLLGSALQRALDARLCPLQHGVASRDGGGERAGGKRKADMPRAHSPGAGHEINSFS